MFINKVTVFQCLCVSCSGSSDQLNESYSDHGDGESPVKAGGRMTRLRARGGVRDRPPIIDDDDEEMFQPAPLVITRKRKPGAGRKPAAERVEKEKPIVEKPPRVVRASPVHPRAAAGGDDRERDVTQDETSLYYIIRHSKSAIAVKYFIVLQ